MEKFDIEDLLSSKLQCCRNIIAETTDKIKLGLSLPKLLANDAMLLQPFLSLVDLEYMQREWRKHTLIEKTPTWEVKKQVLFVTKVIQYNQLWCTSECFEEVLKLCSKTFLILQKQDLGAYCDVHLQEMVSKAGETFLRAFEKLGNFPVQKTTCSSKTLKDNKKEETEHSDLTQKANQELIEAQIKYEDLKAESDQMLDEKQRIIDDYRMKLEAIRQNVSKNIGKIIERSEEKITSGIRSSTQRQGNMLKTLTATEEKLKNLQEFNRSKEEALHVIRKNAEVELKSLIHKYDEDMNRKQCELENLMAQFEKEKIMFIELQKNFEIQNEIYVKLMAEKSEYEQMLWDQRLLEVRQKFAARKIQRCVRNYLAKLKTRKKYGSRKKGKKAAKK